MVNEREIMTLQPVPPPDFRIAYGEDPNQFGYLRLPAGKGPHPMAVVIHGGFWRTLFDLEHSGHMCAALAKAGVATWSLEYRRIGQPGGGWPGTCEDILQGASKLWEFGEEHDLDLSRVIAMGHSAGGHLALWLAAQRRLALRGVISLAGVADLRHAFELGLSNTVVRDFMGGLSPSEADDAYRAASPLELEDPGVPVKLIHGDCDGIVPIEISERYAAKFPAAELIRLQGGNHFVVIDPRSAEWAVVERTVKELLR